MAPFSRQIRAALAMDTIDMTFQAALPGARSARPVTDLHTALRQTVAA
jgi:hypothetical protein